MRRSVAMLGVSLCPDGGLGRHSPVRRRRLEWLVRRRARISVVPSEAIGRRGGGSCPLVVARPHGVGSKVIVPSTWSMVPSPNAGSSSQNNELNGVSCVTSSFCMAAGSYARSGATVQTLVERWNGTAWSIVASPNTSATQRNLLTGVSCLTSSFCVASATPRTAPPTRRSWSSGTAPPGPSWRAQAPPQASTTISTGSRASRRRSARRSASCPTAPPTRRSWSSGTAPPGPSWRAPAPPPVSTTISTGSRASRRRSARLPVRRPTVVTTRH